MTTAARRRTHQRNSKLPLGPLAARMDALREIEALVAHGGRWAGSDAERRAAEQLAGRLRALGREAALESIEVRPDYPLTHALGGLLAASGSVLSPRWPRLGLAALFVAGASTYGDLTTRFHLLRRLTRRVGSQNVVSRERHDKPAVLVLVAHYDSAHTGWIFDPRAAERRSAAGGARSARSLPSMWSLAAALGLALARLAGARGRG